MLYYSSRVFLLACCLFILLNDSISQTFKPDVNGYINDVKFHELIKERGYQLVSAFDTLDNVTSIILATVVKDDKVYQIDLNGTEIHYHEYNDLQSKRREDLLEIPNNSLKNKYEELGVLDLNFKIIQADSKKGVVNNRGEIILPPVYQNIMCGKSGYIFINIEKKWGIADTLGKIIIAPKYDNVNTCMVESQTIKFFIGTINGLKCLVSKEGKELFPPKYDVIDWIAHNGILLTHFVNKNNQVLMGMLDTLGNILYEPTFLDLHFIGNSNLYMFRNPESAKIGIMYKRGEIIHQPKFNFLETYREKKLLHVDSSRKIGFIDENGNTVVPIMYDAAVLNIDDSIIIVSKIFKKEEIFNTFKHGVLDIKGDEILPIEYDEIKLAQNALLARKGSEYFSFARNGKFLKKYKYSEMTCYKNNFIVKKDDFFGLINLNEKVVLPFIYKKLQNIDERYFSTDIGIIDLSNKLILSLDYDDLIPCNKLLLNKSGFFTTLKYQNSKRQIICRDRYKNQYNPQSLLN